MAKQEESPRSVVAHIARSRLSLSGNVRCDRPSGCLREGNVIPICLSRASRSQATVDGSHDRPTSLALAHGRVDGLARMVDPRRPRERAIALNLGCRHSVAAIWETIAER